MASDQEMASWRSSMPFPSIIEGDRLVVDVVGSQSVDVPRAPADVHLDLRSVGSEGEVTLRVRERAPESITIRAHPSMRAFAIDAEPPIASLLIELDEASHDVTLDGRADVLAIVNAQGLRVRDARFEELRLVDSTLTEAGGPATCETFVLEGEVRLEGSAFNTERLVIERRTQLTIGSAGLSAGVLSSRGPILTLVGRLDVGHIQSPFDIELHEAATVRITGAEHGGVASLGVTGHGTVHLGKGVVLSGTFHPVASESLELRLDERSQLRSGRGELVLNAGDGSFCSGPRDGELVLQRITSASNAILQDVNVYELREADLVALEGAARVSIWLPRFQRQRIRRARQMPVGLVDISADRRPQWPLIPRELIDAARVDGASEWQILRRIVLPQHGATLGLGLLPGLFMWVRVLFTPRWLFTATRRGQAQFWSRLVAILRDTHAPGNLQSKARFTATDMRRRSLRSWLDRERLLLEVYRLIGYGEKIVRPLLGHAVAALLMTYLLVSRWDTPVIDAQGQMVDIGSAELFYRVLISPLAFFRFTESLRVEGLVPESLLMGVRVLGVVLLFFAVAAVRRVGKAE